MQFDEIKVIWDSQNEEPLYAIDESALIERVKQTGRGLSRELFIFEVMMILICCGTACAFIVDAIFEGPQSIHQFFSAAILYGMGIHVFRQSRRRRNAELAYDKSLLGRVDESIMQVKFLIQRWRSYWWCFILPFLVIEVIGMTFNYKPKLWFLNLAMPLCLIFTQWNLNREIRRTYLPKQRDLEGLRQKLTDAENED